MRRLLLLVVLIAATARANDPDAPAYFPLTVGNWWTYEELDDAGAPLARETWRVVGNTAAEFHVRSATKRLDALGHGGGRRWEGHEYLRRTSAGIENAIRTRRRSCC
ncbi:MAG TPA: hypothetical protein VKA21_02155 [Candidatus Binatia bacterium]|nr:hypothetical protein [Candidatus Binatia bacterium]